MENKTISYLNSKAWYRFLKVVFVVALLTVLSMDILSIVNGFGTIDNTYYLGFPFPSFPSYAVISIPAPFHLIGIELLIISIPLILLIFELIRRAFYYTVLGSFNPKK